MLSKHKENTYEVNFDCLASPFYHHAGLSKDNLASLKYKNKIASPRKAALQGLEKMKLLMDLGLKQAVLPPHFKAPFSFLERFGFCGKRVNILENAFLQAPELFSAAFAPSEIWAANAATVTPSSDAKDGKVHITPANLLSQTHRANETHQTHALFKYIFKEENLFTVHSPLPCSMPFCDEGAANHIRLCPDHASAGVHLFCFGRKVNQKLKTKQFFPRQTLEASQAIARLHKLNPECTLFVEQSATAIDAGVFHNDVISCGNEHLFIYHESAFQDTFSSIKLIKNSYKQNFAQELSFISIPKTLISLKDAVKTYFFNAQLLTLPNRSMLLLLPSECEENKKVSNFIEEKIVSKKNHPIKHIKFIYLNESMQNGGGPACLRLRLPLKEKELTALPKSIFLTPALYTIIKKWVQKHYPEELAVEDLKDTKYFESMQHALAGLYKQLGLETLIPAVV